MNLENKATESVWSLSLLVRDGVRQNVIGPWPMQLVVVMAVRKAVSAATTTFTAISITLFFIVIHYSLFTIH